MGCSARRQREGHVPRRAGAAAAHEIPTLWPHRQYRFDRLQARCTAASSLFGVFGITANCICPGIIVTDMGRTNLENPALAQSWIKKTALRRLGQPEDVAGPVCFLASDASAFVTGQSLNVCGGIVLS